MFVSRCHSEVADDVNLFCSVVLHLNNSPVLDRTFKILYSVNCSLPHPRCIRIHLKNVRGVILIAGKTWETWRPGPAAAAAQQSAGPSATRPSRSWSAPRFGAKQHRPKKGVPWRVDMMGALKQGIIMKENSQRCKRCSTQSRVPACSRQWPKLHTVI